MLVADIGGTNARFALARRAAGPAGFVLEQRQDFRAEDFDNLQGALGAYCESLAAPAPRRACFAIAAPPSDGLIRLTNSPWTVDRQALMAALDLDTLLVVNDFAAMTSGTRFMGAGDQIVVREGRPVPDAPRAVLGPGTGLGFGLLVPCGADRMKIVATEGGHASFAPQTDEEIEIMRLIRREHESVCFEHLLSGRGLVNIHRALCVLAGTPRISLRPAQITAAATGTDYPLARRAVEVFCAVLGSCAGDFAMVTGALGGLVIAGGIVPKIADVFLHSPFLERFGTPGYQKDYLKNVPVALLTSGDTALIGAAHMLEEQQGRYR